MPLNHFNYNLTDFDRLTQEQQFVNVAQALDRIETRCGGLSPEAVWTHAKDLLDSLKNVPRPEITVQRMFSCLVEELKKEHGESSQEQLEHTAYCILFCVNYILCANDEEPDPNQEIIDNISADLCKMPDIVALSSAVLQVEDEQEEKGHKVEPHNVLAKPRQETVQEATVRILGQLEQDIIQPIINNQHVQPSYMGKFKTIWEDLLAEDDILSLMRQPTFGKDYNLKLVCNILALMNEENVLKASNNKLDKLLFPDKTHLKYFKTEVGSTYSAFTRKEERAMVRSVFQ